MNNTTHDLYALRRVMTGGESRVLMTGSLDTMRQCATNLGRGDLNRLTYATMHTTPDGMEVTVTDECGMEVRYMVVLCMDEAAAMESTHDLIEQQQRAVGELECALASGDAHSITTAAGELAWLNHELRKAEPDHTFRESVSMPVCDPSQDDGWQDMGDGNYRRVTAHSEE